MMAGIRLDRSQVRPTSVVESPDERWITLESKRRRHVFDALAFPKPARAAKGRHAALRRDAPPGENDATLVCPPRHPRGYDGNCVCCMRNRPYSEVSHARDAYGS